MVHTCISVLESDGKSLRTKLDYVTPCLRKAVNEHIESWEDECGSTDWSGADRRSLRFSKGPYFKKVENNQGKTPDIDL